MNKKQVRQMIKALSAYSNPHNWDTREGYSIWVGEGNGPSLAQSVLDQVTKDHEAIHTKQFEFHWEEE